MLHSKKSQAILQWFNSLTTKGDVNSLEQFADGSHFYEIVTSLEAFLPQVGKEDQSASEPVIFSETSIACNEEVITSVEEEAAEGKKETSVSKSISTDPFVIKESDGIDIQQKYDVIEKFINAIYKIDSSSLIDYKECQKGKELELAKVAVFLLSAMVQHLVPSGDETVLTITLLEQEVQENIHECLSLVLIEKDPGENWIKKSDLHKILSRGSTTHKGTPLRKQPSRAPDPNDSTEGTKSASKKRKERTSVVYEDPRDSPLKSLLESPKIQYRAAMFKKDSEMTKLRSALYSEENKVNDLTLEKQNLYEQLAKIKKELEFYKNELESQRKVLSEKEEQERLSAEEIKNKKIEEERLRKLVESQEGEIKELREIIEALEQKVVDVEKKIEHNAASSLTIENNSLKDKIQVLELDNEKKTETISSLNERITSFEYDIRMYQQMMQDSLSNSRKELKGSPNAPETLSTIIYAAEQSSRESWERKEQELKQDLETKDERIKRLEHQQRKGETSKNRNPNLESLQLMVDHLHGRVDSLEKEKSALEGKLESYELKFGSTADDGSVPRDLNSIKNECDRVGSTTDDVPDDSQPSRTEPDDFLAQGKIDFEKTTLLSIVRQLERKNCIGPAIIRTLKENCARINDSHDVSARLRDLSQALKLPAEPSVTTRRSRLAAEEADANAQAAKVKSLEQENNVLKQNFKSFKIKANLKEDELKNAIKTLEASNGDSKKEIENLREELTLTQEKYIQLEKLANKRNEDAKKALRMFKLVAQQDKKDKETKKECNEECEQLRSRCKQLNQECIEFQQERAEFKRLIKNLEGMLKNFQFDVKQLEKEKKELKQKLWEETSASSRNTADRDALVFHYLQKSKHEPKNKDLELRNEEQRKYSRPIVKVDAYILNSENEPSTSSTSNSMLAGRSIRNSFFQAADEDDFLNESSLAEIHNMEKSGDNRLLEIQRRNTLYLPHLQSSYPLEIQNMTPSERKYYNPEELSFDLGRKSSLYNGKRDIHKKPKPKYEESDSDDSDDSHSFPVKRFKTAETSHTSVPVSKKPYQASYRVAKRPRVQENPGKSSTPLKRVAAFVRRQSTFKTPMSVRRLIGNRSTKNKMH